ncbi:Ig-like domain-containing protein [Natronospora cellulosivora (SeqCode)]
MFSRKLLIFIIILSIAMVFLVACDSSRTMEDPGNEITYGLKVSMDIPQQLLPGPRIQAIEDYITVEELKVSLYQGEVVSEVAVDTRILTDLTADLEVVFDSIKAGEKYTAKVELYGKLTEDKEIKVLYEGVSTSEVIEAGSIASIEVKVKPLPAQSLTIEVDSNVDVSEITLRLPCAEEKLTKEYTGPISFEHGEEGLDLRPARWLIEVLLDTNSSKTLEVLLLPTQEKNLNIVVNEENGELEIIIDTHSSPDAPTGFFINNDGALEWEAQDGIDTYTIFRNNENDIENREYLGELEDNLYPNPEGGYYYWVRAYRNGYSSRLSEGFYLGALGDLGLKIIGIEELEKIELNARTEKDDLALPEEVKVILEDESSRYVEVVWDLDDYNKEKLGEQTLRGELINIPGDISNPDELEAELVVKLSILLSNVNLSSNLVYAGQTEDIRIEIIVDHPREQLKLIDEEKEWVEESPVELFIEDSDLSWKSIAYLFDSGNLEEHGNELRGDRHYSNVIPFEFDQIGVRKFKLLITDLEGNEYKKIFHLEVIESDLYNIQMIIDIHDYAENKFKDILKEQGFDIENNINELKLSLEGFEEVDYVINFEYYLQIRYSNGLKSFIIFKDGEARGNLAIERIREALPLEEQTRFSEVETIRSSNIVLSSQNSEEFIGSRDVLLWAAYCSDFSPYCEASVIKETLEEHDLGYNVTKFTDSNADLSALSDMYNYGLIILTTHGLIDNDDELWVMTNEFLFDLEDYEYEINNGSMAVISSLDGTLVSDLEEFDFDDESTLFEGKYIINADWFEANLNGDFNDAILFNNSCYGAANTKLWDVFREKGVETYLGWDDAVSNFFAYERSLNFLEVMKDGNIPAIEGYDELTCPFGANWIMWGNENIKIPAGLVNGDFERGLNAWSPDGDGRAISGLGLIQAIKGNNMAIISTGLGYTDRYGSIQQSFYVMEEKSLLTFNWNYLSEEFLDYIGSVYQDPFRVTINGDEIMYRTVDCIAAEFGASKNQGGSLSSISPDIVFDRGDVWKTGWQEFEYDISEYQGQLITLKFEAYDEGDEIFDTAILLDNIRVE